MKIRAPSFLKHFIVSILMKSKTSSIKNKARLFFFSLTHNKKMLFASIMSKFHHLLGHLEKESDDEEEESRMKAVAAHAAVDEMDLDAEEEDHDDEHCDGDMHSGQEIVELEDEIDRVADIFIRRFHREMKLQKMESFKRLQEMLQRSV